jgi:hypothetical protein
LSNPCLFYDGTANPGAENAVIADNAVIVATAGK